MPALESRKLRFRRFIYGRDQVRDLAENDVHLWTALLSKFGDMDRYEGLLSKDEARESRLIGSERNRRLYVAGKGILRTILSEYTNIHPHNINIERDLSGRPKLAKCLKDPTLSFNLSHSEDVILCAFARHVTLGVDVQYAHRVPVCADALLLQDESRLISCAPEPLQAEMFLRIWTLKEAFLKATSRGLEAIDSVAVRPVRDSSELTIKTRGPFMEIEIFTFTPGRNYFATVLAGWSKTEE